MRITVIGGGNGSLAGAADFALAGHEVTLWRRNEDDIRRHQELNNIITVKDKNGLHEARLARTTSDIAAAMRGAEFILCPLPATTHEDLAKVLAPHFETGQVIYFPPGTLGRLIFARAAHEAGTVKGVAFAETGTLPWLVRKHGFNHVVISGRGTRLPTGVFPLDLEDHAIAVISRAFPGAIEPCGDVLSAALMNAGPIIHPPLITLNAGPLEHFDAWDIHNEGTQAAIRRVTDALDGERMQIREALGYAAPHFPLADHYRDDGDEWMYGRKSHDSLTDSGDWREKIILTSHRYMLEDVRLGLSLMVSAAKLAGIDAPLSNAFLAIGSAICTDDFAKNGRPLAKAGLAGMDRQQIATFLRSGYAS